MEPAPASLKTLARDWLLPAVFRYLSRLRGGGIRLEGHYATWEEAAAQCTGYNASQILDKVLDATLKVKSGEASFERDSVLFNEIQYSWPVLAGLMWAAARSGGRLNVLDFGGALGSSYFQNWKFLSTLPEVRWNVVEQAHYVDAGRTHIQDEHLRFYATVVECLKENVPNVILLSGVLQIIPDPRGLLGILLAEGCETVILDRTCFLNKGNRELIKIQHVPESIYKASYPCRFFVEDDVLEIFFKAGYKLVEKFQALDKLDSSATWKGHIFMRHNND